MITFVFTGRELNIYVCKIYVDISLMFDFYYPWGGEFIPST